MKKSGYALGGEQSGHIICADICTTGDGLATALMTTMILAASKKKFSEITKVMQVMPQVLKNARVSNGKKYKFLEDEVIKRVCKELEDEFHGEGRVLIRPSGTEPLVRVMIEANDLALITRRADELVIVIEERLR
jgi:phosphoglucosamine mutase